MWQLLDEVPNDVLVGSMQPLVVMSNVSSLLTVLAFGMTDKYGLALAARLTGGLFNCTFL